MTITRPSTSTTLSHAKLEGQLAAHRWIRRNDPFPHFLAYDVFKPDVYEQLASAFNAAVGATQDRPYLEKHDIHGRTLTPDIASPFNTILSREWHDLVANVLGITATGHIAAGLHHHRVGSSHGFPHNDFNPGWFNGDAAPDTVEIGDDFVNYTTGVALQSGAQPYETVRAASLLFYLSNPPWEPGDGGMTGLYGSDAANIEEPVSCAPPINNSLLLFECTPQSFHGFISNRVKPRNSIVQWLHQSKDDALAKWGPDSIVPYGAVPPKRRTA